MDSIILVEDEQPIRELLFEFLQDLGYQVLAFETADLAWEHIRERRYPVRLLITDLRVPGDMDGLDLIKRLRSTAPNTPVVVVSGFHQESSSLRNDDIYWLGKPFPLQRLEMLCQEIVSSESPFSVSYFRDSES